MRLPTRSEKPPYKGWKTMDVRTKELTSHEDKFAWLKLDAMAACVELLRPESYAVDCETVREASHLVCGRRERTKLDIEIAMARPLVRSSHGTADVREKVATCGKRDRSEAYRELQARAEAFPTS